MHKRIEVLTMIDVLTMDSCMHRTVLYLIVVINDIFI